MPKRKAPKEEAIDAADSDLSPPPDGLIDDDRLAKAINGTEGRGHAGKKANHQPNGQIIISEEDGADLSRTVKKRARKQTVKLEVYIEETAEVLQPGPKAVSEQKQKRKRTVKEEVRQLDENGEIIETKVKKKRKTKAEKEAELVEMPLAARTLGHKLYIGAHVSSAGGVHQSVLNSVHIGANAFALFLKSQRKWTNPPIQDDHRTAFHDGCETHRYDQTQHIVPHGSYLVNLAHTDPTRTQQAYEGFLDDLRRCESLGISLYNFHPGNVQCGDRSVAIAHLASNINRAHGETSTVVTLLENMAAGGNVLGSTFEDLRDIIALVANKQRVGVCLDTCHAFAAGYDLRTAEAFNDTMSHFDAVVGLKYLRAVHMNDSKAPFGSHKDLHANIGTGFLGLRAFHHLVNDSRFVGLPLVLETPIDVRDEEGNYVKDEKGKANKEDKGIWAREIKMLESMVGMNIDGAEFRETEARLSKVGGPERKRLEEQIIRVRQKKEKAAKSPRKRKMEEVVDDALGNENESSLSDLEDEDIKSGDDTPPLKD